MAEPTNELLYEILKDLQARQRDQSQVLDNHSKSLADVEKRLDEMHQTMVTAVGFAGHANIRHETVTERLHDLTRPIEQLEQAR